MKAYFYSFSDRQSWEFYFFFIFLLGLVQTKCGSHYDLQVMWGTVATSFVTIVKEDCGQLVLGVLGEKMVKKHHNLQLKNNCYQREKKYY